MDRLYTPWRYDYIKGASGEKTSSGTCIFCKLPAIGDDEQTFIVHRAAFNYIVLNIYPYISGHLMIVPFEHTADFSNLSRDSADEMMELAQRAHAILGDVYKPHGFNLGMNLGQSAGAGVTDHLHMHVLPRWTGDANFMSTVGETRVIPEDLQTTFHKLANRF